MISNCLHCHNVYCIFEMFFAIAGGRPVLYCVSGVPGIPDNISDCEARLQQCRTVVIQCQKCAFFFGSIL